MAKSVNANPAEISAKIVSYTQTTVDEKERVQLSVQYLEDGVAFGSPYDLDVMLEEVVTPEKTTEFLTNWAKNIREQVKPTVATDVAFLTGTEVKTIIK